MARASCTTPLLTLIVSACRSKFLMRITAVRTSRLSATSREAASIAEITYVSLCRFSSSCCASRVASTGSMPCATTSASVFSNETTSHSSMANTNPAMIMSWSFTERPIIVLRLLGVDVIDGSPTINELRGSKTRTCPPTLVCRAIACKCSTEQLSSLTNCGPSNSTIQCSGFSSSPEVRTASMTARICSASVGFAIASRMAFTRGICTFRFWHLISKALAFPSHGSPNSLARASTLSISTGSMVSKRLSVCRTIHASSSMRCSRRSTSAAPGNSNGSCLARPRTSSPMSTASLIAPCEWRLANAVYLPPGFP
mmetsp:Transcript_805/g.1780  ORF Transcript_805/g.1780 Transcript_805/m.1780 type:complete len:313 (+) Transcript_805:1855-2793(+)